MKKGITGMAGIFLLGTVLTIGGCGWGPWHGHGRGWHGYASGNSTLEGYWHGPQYGYNHFTGCGHPGY